MSQAHGQFHAMTMTGTEAGRSLLSVPVESAYGELPGKAAKLTSAVFRVDLAVFVSHFSAAKVFGVAVPASAGRFAATGICAVIAVIGMVAGIDVAVEVVMAVVPGAGADEDAAVEPLRAVVAVGRAAVRACGVVAIGANGSGADVDADLGIGAWSRYEQKGAGQSGQRKVFRSVHDSPHSA